jgi:hypothetical protein
VDSGGGLDVGFEGVGFLVYRLERASEPNGSRASLLALIEMKKQVFHGER